MVLESFSYILANESKSNCSLGMLSSGKLRPGKEKKEQPQLKLIYTEISKAT
jgi:hypothetical protein